MKMEENKENQPENPSAFPDLAVIRSGDNFTQQIRQSGMSLRDYFAAKAMYGVLANSNLGPSTNEEIAQSCYKMADAMLKERSKYEASV